MSWYRIYRPQQISELEIAPVREYFQQVLKTGQYSHAYLFTGPRGTGKTSTARILARVLNDPANRAAVLERTGPLQEPSLDEPILQRIAQGRSQGVIEQDAASHRGIDDIRQLQEEVSVVPTEGVIRVVILDEVHMLTAEAFNALLKLLEEPPARVVFILATTELHKVPATILSRCQMVRFRLATHDELKTALDKIIQAENLSLEPEALESLITAANGSFRDGVKWLEQVAVSGKVTLADVQRIVGSTQVVTDLLRALATKNLAQLQQIFSDLRQAGSSFSALETSLLQALHERLTRAIARTESTSTIQNVIALLEFLSVRLGGGPEPLDGLRLEVACYRWALGEGGESAGSSTPPESHSEKTAKPSTSTTASVQISASSRAEFEAAVAPQNDLPKVPKITDGAQLPAGKWERILLSLRTESTAVEALLRTSSPGTFENKVLNILVARPFHLEQLNNPKYAQLLTNILQQQLGEGVKAKFTLREQDPNEFKPTDTTPDDFAKVVEKLVSQI